MGYHPELESTTCVTSVTGAPRWFSDVSADRCEAIFQATGELDHCRDRGDVLSLPVFHSLWSDRQLRHRQLAARSQSIRALRQ
jgi:hypothetical protein